MNIEELKERHYDTDRVSKTLNKPSGYAHTKLSIEFAISVLEDLNAETFYDKEDDFNNKIQELKTYLDEK